MNAVVLSSIACIAGLMAWMIVRAVRATVPAAKAVGVRIEPVPAALRQGRTPSPDQIQVLAADELTRVPLYRALKSAGRSELFPAEYATAEALADVDGDR